jgi:thiamine pyrophosphokinase
MTTLILLGGERPSIKLAQTVAASSDRIVAADSGYLIARECGLRPDVLTGDFDSIGEVPESPGLHVIPAHEQDATDFEKALRHVTPGTSKVLVLGGTGLRADHFLTNLLIASGLDASLSVTFIDDMQALHRVTPACTLSVTVDPGTIVSLIPFASCHRVSTRGLHWNLDQKDMGPPDQFGQSNIAKSDCLEVSIGSGVLYAVVNHTGQG